MNMEGYFLAPVVQLLQQGWSVQCQSGLSQFFSRKTELSLYEGCILLGTYVVIPAPGREAVLAELHEGHPEIA